MLTCICLFFLIEIKINLKLGLGLTSCRRVNPVNVFAYNQIDPHGSRSSFTNVQNDAALKEYYFEFKIKELAHHNQLDICCFIDYLPL